MPTVDQSDVEAILGRDLTVAEQARADRLIEMAEAQVESLLPGISLASGTATEESIVNDDPDILWTARYPVTEVTELKIIDSVLSSTSYTFTEKGKITLGRRTVLNEWEIEPLTGAVGPYSASYEFGYGYDLPADIAAAVAAGVAALVSKQATNPGDIRAETIGSYSVTYAWASEADKPAGLVPPPDVLLRRYGRTKQVSVPLVRFR